MMTPAHREALTKLRDHELTLGARERVGQPWLTAAGIVKQDDRERWAQQHELVASAVTAVLAQDERLKEFRAWLEDEQKRYEELASDASCHLRDEDYRIADDKCSVVENVLAAFDRIVQGGKG